MAYGSRAVPVRQTHLEQNLLESGLAAAIAFGAANGLLDEHGAFGEPRVVLAEGPQAGRGDAATA